jgi:two-component system, NtrC family, response regulator AtoC
MQTDQNKSSDRVLIVEDEENARRGYEALLQKWGLDVLGVSSAEDALARFSDYHPSVLIADVELPGMDGLSLLERLGDDLASVPAIIITGKGSEERAVAAIEAGAFWYIEKPLKGAVLRALLNRALGKVRDQQQVAALRRQLREAGRIGELVGAAKPMQEVMRLVEQVAPSSASVLITGETGSGKEILARTLHQLSPRTDRPFVAINCSAIPETLMEAELFGHEKGAFTDAKQMKKGLFEAADGGTLFLDEIGELSPLLQAKLLRVLEDQVIRRVGGIRDMQVDVRVIAASNRDLEKAVRDGQFRQDLYYRLAIIAIFIPPLRDRKEDIMPLVDFFIERYNRRFKKSIRGITDDTRRLIFSHNWPGNVRELKNTIERGMILEDEPFLRPVYLPFSVGESGGRTVFERTSSANDGQTLPNGRTLPRLYIPEGGTSLEEVEHAMVELAMRQSNGNQTHAAKLLDISRDALRYKLKKFGLIRGDEEGAQAASADEP